jgi:hypothetical protein
MKMNVLNFCRKLILVCLGVEGGREGRITEEYGVFEK